MFETPFPEITDPVAIGRPQAPLPPIFDQQDRPVQTLADAERTRTITTSITAVQGEVAKFDQIAAGLAAIEAAHPKNVIVAAIETPAGMRQAETSWRAYRNPRLEVERARKAAKAPVLALGKAIDTFAGGLEDRLRAGEDHYKAQIDTEANRQAAVKAEQERIEREAAERHAARRAAISMYALRSQEPGMTAERIAAGMARLQGADMSDPDNGRAVDLADLQCRTLETMRTLHAQAVAREAEAARQEQIRIENERVAAELAAERQRIAAEAEAIRRQAAELEAQRAESARLEVLAVANRERLAREAQERHIQDAQASTVPSFPLVATPEGDRGPVLSDLDEANASARAFIESLPSEPDAALAREAQIHAAGTQAMQAEARRIDAPRVVLLEEPGVDPAAELQALAAEARESRFPTQPTMGVEWWARFYALADAAA